MRADLNTRIVDMMADAGRPGAVLSVSPCSIGGNNRTFRVSTSEGVFAAKQYFRHEADSRDRLRSEFLFLTYAAKAAPGKAPAPVAMDPEAGLALYEFVEGRPFVSGKVNWDHVRQAAGFFIALNSPQSRMEAAGLPVASEACFSIRGHLDLVGSRLAGLSGVKPAGVEDDSALALVEDINIRWRDLVTEVESGASRAGLDPAALLREDERCISPSDFGFHNALVQTDGAIRFLDFEYAGWDDPAKLAGDFFSQLAAPVPGELFDQFVDAIMAAFAGPTDLRLRARLLRPVYRIKWCCIALNVFLPVNLARRRFADPDLDIALLKRQQLVKANTLFNALET